MKTLNEVLEKHLPILREELTPMIEEWTNLHKQVEEIEFEATQKLQKAVKHLVLGDNEDDLLEITVNPVTNVRFHCATDNRTIVDIYARGTRDEETGEYYIQKRDVHVHWTNTSFGISIRGDEILDPLNTLVTTDMRNHMELAHRLILWIRNNPQDLERIVSLMSGILREMKQKTRTLLVQATDIHQDIHNRINVYTASDLVYNDFSFGMDVTGFVDLLPVRYYRDSYLEPKFNKKTASKIVITHTSPDDTPTNETRNKTMKIQDLNDRMAAWVCRRLKV